MRVSVLALLFFSSTSFTALFFLYGGELTWEERVEGSTCFGKRSDAQLLTQYAFTGVVLLERIVTTALCNVYLNEQLMGHLITFVLGQHSSCPHLRLFVLLCLQIVASEDTTHREIVMAHLLALQ